MSTTQEYVFDRASRIGTTNKARTHKDFGRAVADLVLRSTAKEAALMTSGRQGIASVELGGAATITENTPASCMTVAIATPLGTATAHVG